MSAPNVPNNAQAGARNRPGKLLGGRYLLLNQIAKGGMGEVWKARDKITGSVVAAKVLRPELMGEEISLSRLRLEAKNAMRIKHPNIASVLDSGEESAQGWIIMELVEGHPLTHYVGNGKRLSEKELLPVLVQTSYALDAAARAEIVHRDIKPANILVRPDGLVKLTDFGVSYRDGQASLTAAGMVMGTAQYLPPEQALGKPATPVGDLYALGVIAFEALAGHRPYTGKNQVDIAFAHVNEEIPTLPGDVSPPFAALIYRMLSKEPEGRPQTGGALARELLAVATELGLEVSPHPLTEAANKRTGGILPSTRPEGTPKIQPPVASAAPAQPAAFPPAPVASRMGTRQSRTAPSAAATTPRQTPPAVPRMPVSPGESPSWRPVSRQSVDQVASRPRPATPPTGRRRPPDVPQSLSNLADPAPTEPENNAGQWGLWVIIGLVALTVVLIIIAMVRAGSGTTETDALALVSAVHIQEVATWPMPTPGA